MHRGPRQLASKLILLDSILLNRRLTQINQETQDWLGWVVFTGKVYL
jgi:hypothetical protein